MDKAKRISISKKLSYFLRHGLNTLPFKVDESGFVKITDLLNLPDFEHVTIADILFEVENNEKKRFSLDETGEKIRANQGHSLESGKLIDENLLLKKITEPQSYCVHGTKQKFMQSINKSGLNSAISLRNSQSSYSLFFSFNVWKFFKIS